MSHSKCFRCGALTDSVLPAPLCVTCHGREDDTHRPQAAPTDAPTAGFAPPTTDALTRTNPADPFGVLPAGGYVYGRLLGQGGMGCVYQAVRVSTGQTVAVKKLRAERYFPGLIQRFVREARILDKLNHPNVVRLLDFVPAAGDPHIVMEFVDGLSLADRLTDGRPLAADTAARLIADAARGVQAVHEAGVIHRDLKPGNLLVTADGRVKVTDFGLGKLTEADDGLTVVGGPVGGTPGYSAPEQVAESGASDARTDVWGLGACLYAALTGRPPFLVGRANLTRVLSDPLLPPRAFTPAVPPVLDAIACKCLERDPDLRYQSAAALADDLDRYRRGESTEARPLPWATRAWRRVRAIPRATAAAWAMTAAAVAVIAVLLTAGGTPAVAGPVDEKAQLEAQFRAGQAVTLVPATGLPRWSQWASGGGVVQASRMGDDSTEVETTTRGLLKLFDPPGLNYRVDLEVRQLSAQAWAGAGVGFFVGHERMTGPAGEQLDAAVSVRFNDIDPAVPALGRHTPQPFEAEQVMLYRHRPGAPSMYSRHRIHDPAAAFTAHPTWPGRWRRLSAEVSPDRLRVLWYGDSDLPLADPVVVVDRSGDDLTGDWLNAREVAAANRSVGLRTHVDPDLIPTVWKPDGGFGLLCTGAAATFRNVTVTPTKPAR